MVVPKLSADLIESDVQDPEGDPLMTADLEPLTRFISDQDATVPAPSSATGSFHRVDVRHASEMSYEDFVHHYMAPNRPVLIQGAMEGWRACREWVREDGCPDVAALEALVGGDTMVCVTDTRQQQDGCGLVEEMRLAEYLRWWRSGRVGQQQQQQQQQAAGALHPSCATPGEGESQGHVPHYYLKDWHFCSVAPAGYKAYEVPCYFSSDWLNDYYDAQNKLPIATGDDNTEALPADMRSATAKGTSTADYRFVYLGPAGSWTPLHSDVLRSYSWSANVAGVKRWLLLPPERTHLLYDRHYKQLAPDFGLDTCGRASNSEARTDVATSSVLAGGGAAALAATPAAHAVQRPFLENPQLMKVFPRLPQAHPYLIECIQGPGDILFVPSGMHHTVTNLCDTLSINHNWINPFNIKQWTWPLLRAQRKKAEAAIEDCRALCASAAEFQVLVDQNLEADSGMDLQGFAHFVAVATASELSALQHLDQHTHEGLNLEKCSLHDLGRGSLDKGAAVSAWHTFSLKRAVQVLDAIAEEAQAAGGDSSRSHVPALNTLSLPQLVHGIGCKALESNAHFDFLPFLLELVRRATTILNV